MTSPLDSQIDELVRERGRRQGFYPAWVAAKKITQHQADAAMAALDAAIDTLVHVRAQGQVMDATYGADEAPVELAVRLGKTTYNYVRKNEATDQPRKT